jgi:monoamine oxidase
MTHHLRRSVEVVVVGAGVAGLPCADRLLRRGVDVLVCEARERVGGRTDNVEIDVEIIDLGGLVTLPATAPQLNGEVRPAVTVATFATDVSPRAHWCPQMPDPSHNSTSATRMDNLS